MHRLLDAVFSLTTGGRRDDGVTELERSQDYRRTGYRSSLPHFAAADRVRRSQ
jgi:hypothetical protein